ncbi:MAG: histidine phosphatase family protein [Treponema sp.]|nr:MAG: histidine phosphatase family protein [Treponema sp.]
MRVVFVRHGRTCDNDNKVFSGDDACLSEEGAEELLAVKPRLADFYFDRIYVSPAIRAVRTAQILGFSDFMLDDRIKEFDFGDFTGKTFAQVEAEFPKEASVWLSGDKNFAPPAGESAFEHFSRVADFMETLKASAEDCLVVTHYGTIIMALAWAFGNFDLHRYFKPESGGITVLNFSENSVILEKFNF